MAVGSGVGVSIGAAGTITRVKAGVGVEVSVGVKIGVGVSVGVGVVVGVWVKVGIGVSVGVAEAVGVVVGVEVSVGVAVAVSTKGNIATAPTAPSSLTWLTILRSSPGVAPLSSKVAARELIIKDGAIMPHNQIITRITNNRRSLAARLRLANQTAKLLFWRCRRRFEVTRGCKVKALLGPEASRRRFRRGSGRLVTAEAAADGAASLRGAGSGDEIDGEIGPVALFCLVCFSAPPLARP